MPENTLPEEADWTAALYQIETDDPVIGGPEGISNRHARQLGNRTLWLKQELEAGSTALADHTASNNHPLATTGAKGMVLLATVAQAVAGLLDNVAVTPDGLAAAIQVGLDSLVGAAPGTLNTLDEIAAALGDDPNAVATIMAVLAGKAPLESPDFTGAPKVPTAAPGTNTTQAASTAFVAGALAAISLAAYARLDTAQTFIKAQRGTVVAVASASVITIDFALANYYSCAAGHNATLALPINLVPGQSGSIWVIQPAAGGPCTWSFALEWDFGNGLVPSLSTTADAVDRLDYLVRSGGSIHAQLTKDVR